MTQHTLGTIRTVESLCKINSRELNQVQKDKIAEIIESNTHTSEMLAFIDKVAEDNRRGIDACCRILDLQAEAVALIKKVRD